MTIFQDIFLYFARFADRNGVLKNFTKNSGSDEYNWFKAAVDMLPESPIISGINDFILAPSEESVKKRILTFKSTFLFVDFGEVSSRQSSLKVQEDYFRLALTVAHPLSANTLNMAEEIVLNDRLFNLIRAIREYMKNDRQDPFIKRLTFPQEIQPFWAPALSNSFGWTMVFQMSGIAMI